MELDYSGDKRIAEPALDQVFEYLMQLADNSDGFLILARADQDYVQATAGYYVEFRQGSEDKHFSSVRDDLSLDEAKVIFEKYYNGDEGFQTVVEFKAGMPDAKSGCLASLLFFPFLCFMK
jgi:hypothetical protein